MDLASLRVLVRVAELQSFTRAAEQLRVPKSRVSQQLSALEAALGCRSLHRTTRVVRVTPDGELLLPRARRLLLRAEVSASAPATPALRDGAPKRTRSVG